MSSLSRLSIFVALALIIGGAEGIEVVFSATNCGDTVSIWDYYLLPTSSSVDESSKASFNSVEIKNSRTITGSGTALVGQVYGGDEYIGIDLEEFVNAAGFSITGDAKVNQDKMSSFQSTGVGDADAIGLSSAAGHNRVNGDMTTVMTLAGFPFPAPPILAPVLNYPFPVSDDMSGVTSAVVFGSYRGSTGMSAGESSSVSRCGYVNGIFDSGAASTSGVDVDPDARTSFGIPVNIGFCHSTSASGGDAKTDTSFNVQPGMPIPDAVLVAQNGDSIFLGPGTHRVNGEVVVGESLNFIGAGRYQTTLDCGGANRAFNVPPGFRVNVYFSDFTIQNGGDATNGGAAIKIGETATGEVATNPVVTIERVDFLNNRVTSDGEGGAIRMTRSTLTVNDCSFIGNMADQPIDSDGGAIFVQQSKATIENSRFINNRAYDDGGAIVAIGNGARPFDLTVNNCYFDGNVASGSPASAGGAIGYMPVPANGQISLTNNVYGSGNFPNNEDATAS